MKCMKMTAWTAAAIVCIAMLATPTYAGITVRPTSITGNAQDGFVVKWKPNSEKSFDDSNTTAVSLSALTQAKAYMEAGGKVLIIWRLKDGKYRMEIDLYSVTTNIEVEDFMYTLGC